MPCVARPSEGTLFFLPQEPASTIPAGDVEKPKAEESEFVEPITVEETYPNEVGEYDLRFSLEHRKGEEESGFDLYFLPKLQLFFGIAERFGGEVEIAYLNRDEAGGESTSGPGNLGLAVKYLAYEDRDRDLAIALGLEIELPTADEEKGLGEGRVEYSPMVAFLKDFELIGREIDHVLLQGNVGYTWEVNGETEQRAFYNLSAALSPPHIDSLYLFLELSGTLAEDQEALSLSPGVKYAFGDELFAAFALPISLRDGAEKSRLIFQVQWGF